jgi:hypothetical protein
MHELKNMQAEMLEILEFNFLHFFGDFRSIIVEELVNNFRKIIIKYNAGKDSSFDFYINERDVNYEEIKKILSC